MTLDTLGPWQLASGILALAWLATSIGWIWYRARVNRAQQPVPKMKPCRPLVGRQNCKNNRIWPRDTNRNLPTNPNKFKKCSNASPSCNPNRRALWHAATQSKKNTKSS